MKYGLPMYQLTFGDALYCTLGRPRLHEQAMGIHDMSWSNLGQRTTFKQRNIIESALRSNLLLR